MSRPRPGLLALLRAALRASLAPSGVVEIIIVCGPLTGAFVVSASSVCCESRSRIAASARAHHRRVRGLEPAQAIVGGWSGGFGIFEGSSAGSCVGRRMAEGRLEAVVLGVETGRWGPVFMGVETGVTEAVVMGAGVETGLTSSMAMLRHGARGGCSRRKLRLRLRSRCSLCGA